MFSAFMCGLTEHISNIYISKGVKHICVCFAVGQLDTISSLCEASETAAGTKMSEER